MEFRNHNGRKWYLSRLLCRRVSCVSFNANHVFLDWYPLKKKFFSCCVYASSIFWAVTETKKKIVLPHLKHLQFLHERCHVTHLATFSPLLPPLPLVFEHGKSN
jgi:hypothetical protein